MEPITNKLMRWDADTIMKWVANVIISVGAVALLVVGVVRAIGDESAPTTTAVLAIGFLLVVLLLLAKFKRFKGFGFEAEMWEQKQEEAAALVASLKRELEEFKQKVRLFGISRASLLQDNTIGITETLKPFAGTQFDCGYNRHSGEQVNFWWDLQPALIDAGWKNLPWKYGESTGGISQGGRPETGEAVAVNVEIHIRPTERSKLAQAAVALIAALNDVGIETRDYMGFNAHNTNSDAIHILVGEKQLTLPAPTDAYTSNTTDQLS